MHPRMLLPHPFRVSSLALRASHRTQYFPQTVGTSGKKTNVSQSLQGLVRVLKSYSRVLKALLATRVFALSEGAAGQPLPEPMSVTLACGRLRATLPCAGALGRRSLLRKRGLLFRFVWRQTPLVAFGSNTKDRGVTDYRFLRGFPTSAPAVFHI